MTELEYLHDTYKFESEAKVIAIEEDSQRTAVILDKTIFYSQGGGQPADQGIIYSNGAKFLVTDTRLDAEGKVRHFGEFERGEFEIGENVSLKIDSERRILNARVHSAGHLIDVATEIAGIKIKAVKGYHFSDGPYVEYEGEIENPMDYVDALEKSAKVLVDRAIPIDVYEYSDVEAKAKNIWAPPGKSARAVALRGYKEVGCGGTHVRDTSEIGRVTIRKISSKKGRSKIAYDVK